MPRKVLAKVRIDRFEFKGFHGCRSCCALNIEQIEDGRTVVICSELEDNPGTSITNAVEMIASQAVNQLELDPAKLVWIEHYPPEKVHGNTEDWDLVTFGAIFHDGIRTVFDDPIWRRLGREDWDSLGLEPSIFS
jgi:hypothetical protein